MKQLFAKCTVELTTDDMVTINEMIIRDTALPVIKEKAEFTGNWKYKCPVCKRTIVNPEQDHFCRQCGQRLDLENTQL